MFSQRNFDFGSTKYNDRSGFSAAPKKTNIIFGIAFILAAFLCFFLFFKVQNVARIYRAYDVYSGDWNVAFTYEFGNKELDGIFNIANDGSTIYKSGQHIYIYHSMLIPQNYAKDSSGNIATIIVSTALLTGGVIILLFGIRQNREY